MGQQIINFDNSYTLLPDIFYNPETPDNVSAPKLIKFNYDLADSLNIGVSNLTETEIANYFSGNLLPDGSNPIAQIYGGHQFGHFNVLGDGRAILLGETIAKDGQRYDIQLKGAGRTAYSRNGDGKAALGPVLREYLMSEFMNSLNIPTTRALSFVTSGEKIRRETLLDGAILTRIAKSHIRFGTFQYFAGIGDIKNLKILADYTIARHYPYIDGENKYLHLLEEIAKAHAELVAKWMSVGFIHGVMNTDNASICGITIDYGPCAFMDNYNPQQVYSFIDKRGRYRYDNQPYITQWNLARLAEALLPLINDDVDVAVKQAEEVIINFIPVYEDEYFKIMGKKIGISSIIDGDRQLILKFLGYLHVHNLDYTNSFRELSAKINVSNISNWHDEWQVRLKHENKNITEIRGIMNSNNPAIIMRNHNVERAINAAYQLNDYTLFNEMLEAAQKPFHDFDAYNYLKNSPKENEIVQNTFCGT